jgi:hypothetical protein
VGREGKCLPKSIGKTQFSAHLVKRSGLEPATSRTPSSAGIAAGPVAGVMKVDPVPPSRLHLEAHMSIALLFGIAVALILGLFAGFVLALLLVTPERDITRI